MASDNTETQDPIDHLLAHDAALADLLCAVRTELGDDPAHDLAHALRVARWTLRLGGDELSPRAVVAAALLHDIVNLPKDSPERSTASARSADEARRRLPGLGFPAESVELVAQAIEDHSFSRGTTPRSPLGRALQDADRLEALGAIGLCRCIGTGQRMGARYFDPDDPWAERRHLDDARFSVDHFFTKLLSLPATLKTEGGRREARRRVELLERFLDALAEELAPAQPAAEAAVTHGDGVTSVRDQPTHQTPGLHLS